VRGKLVRGEGTMLAIEIQIQTPGGAIMPPDRNRKASRFSLQSVRLGAVTLSAALGCGGYEAGNAEDPIEVREEALTQVAAVDFESYPLGALGSPWSVSPISGPSTVKVVSTADHGKVLLLHGSNSAYLIASLPFSSSATQITTNVQIKPDNGATFIWTLTGAGSSIGRRRIRLQLPPSTNTLQVQTVPAGTVNCGKLQSGVWSSVTLVVHAQTWPHTADVLINGVPTACSALTVGLSPPFNGVQVMDAGNEGYAGDVRFDNIRVTTP
jgi:hypothetical protein